MGYLTKSRKCFANQQPEALANDKTLRGEPAFVILLKAPNDLSFSHK